MESTAYAIAVFFVVILYVGYFLDRCNGSN
jgi:hypothetical protein